MITQERIDAIYTEVDRYIIDIVEEPRSLGPAYLQERMAVCRNHLNRVSLLFSELSRAKAEAGASLRVLEDTYKLAFDAALATDEHVRRLASVEDRKSTVAYTLRDSQRQINDGRLQVAAIEAALKVVTHRSRELHSTMDILKEERRLMTTDIASGAMYGDERTNTGPAPMDDIDGEELDELLGDVSLPVPDAAPETTVETAPEPDVVEEVSPPPAPVQAAPEPPPEAPATTVAKPEQDEEAVIRQFLDAETEGKNPKTAGNPSEDEDLSAFLDGL